MDDEKLGYKCVLSVYCHYNSNEMNSQGNHCRNIDIADFITRFLFEKYGSNEKKCVQNHLFQIGSLVTGK